MNKLVFGFSLVGFYLLILILGWRLSQPAPLPLVEPGSKIEKAVEKVKSFDPTTLRWVAAPPAPWKARDSHSTFVFDDKLWLMGGLSVPSTGGHVSMEQYAAAEYFNDIWSTEDGLAWQLESATAAFPKARSVSVVEFRGALYRIGGWSPDAGYDIGIWKSEDGVHWKQTASTVPWSDREGQKVFEWNGKLWLLGGVNYFKPEVYNDVWSSADGVNWDLVTERTPWRPRWDEDVAVFNNKLWLAGGMGLGSIGYSDVWSLADGRNWELVTETAPWGTRQGQNLQVYKNFLWLVGGLDAATNAGVGDTWFTADGVNWQKLEATGPWTGREDHGVNLFHGKLWITGGMDADWHWDNGVWYSVLD